MKFELPLAQMTYDEKLDLLETILIDLFRNHSNEDPPEWHRKILEEREKLLAEGKMEVLDFDEVVRNLRQKFNLNRDFRVGD
jgi:hypothetical protein